MPTKMFITMPPESTAMRCQAGLFTIARGASSSVTGSIAVMPAMSQNPPNGSAASPYSVPPRVVDATVGPKPMK